MSVVISPDRPRPRFFLLTSGAMSLVCLWATLIASAGISTLAITGQSAPGGGSFASFAPIDISLSHYASFAATLSGVPASQDHGIFRDSDDGPLQQIVREGQAAIGGGTITALFAPAVDNDGRVSFRFATSNGDNAINRSSPGGFPVALTHVVRGPEAAGTWQNLSNPAAGAGGIVAFRSNESPTVQRIHRTNSVGSLSQMARSGSATLVGGGSVNFGTFSTPALTNDGVVFLATVDGGGTGIYSTSGGPPFTQIARSGQPAPGGGTFGIGFSDPVANPAGAVAFNVNKSVFRTTPSGLSVVAAPGQSAPGGGTFVSAFTPAISAQGHVAFASEVAPAAVGIFRTDAAGGNLAQVTRRGQPAVGGGTFTALSDPALAPGGQVVYRGQIAGAGAGTGLFLSDVTETLAVVRTGQPLAGSTVVNADSNLARDPGGRGIVNQYGQVAYWASLADGRQGVFVYTPELHWRGIAGAGWDTPGAWTLGLAPAAVHDVFITPATPLTMGGSSAFFTVVRSLTIGGPAPVNLGFGSSVIVGGDVVVEAGSTLSTSTNAYFRTQHVRNDGAFEVRTGTFAPASVGNLDGTGATTVSFSSTLAATRVRQASLHIGFNNSRVDVAPNGTNDATSVLRSLSITGGSMLNLSNNDLIVDYTGASLLATIAAGVRGGYNGGAWNGAGINSSSAAATPGFALGYAESSQVFTSFPATFSGQSVDNSAVLVMYTRVGDANLDGTVDLRDFNRVAINFGMPNKFWFDGDFNHDRLVTLADFNLLAAQFGLSAGPDGVVDPHDWSALASAVPEPATIGLLAPAAALLARRTRRTVSFSRAAAS